MQPVNYSTGYKRVKQHIGVGLLIYTCLAVILEMAVILMITYLGLLRFFLTVGGGLGGQILNFPLECSTTSWQGSFVVVEKLLSTPMSI